MKLRIAWKVLDEIYGPTGGLRYRLPTIQRALRRALGGEAIVELPPPPKYTIIFGAPDEMADLLN